jgi:hypothetical protein
MTKICKKCEMEVEETFLLEKTNSHYCIDCFLKYLGGLEDE